jgi:hypothetical protein
MGDRGVSGAVPRELSCRWPATLRDDPVRPSLLPYRSSKSSPLKGGLLGLLWISSPGAGSFAVSCRSRPTSTHPRFS